MKSLRQGFGDAIPNVSFRQPRIAQIAASSAATERI